MYFLKILSASEHIQTLVAPLFNEHFKQAYLFFQVCK